MLNLTDGVAQKTSEFKQKTVDYDTKLAELGQAIDGLPVNPHVIELLDLHSRSGLGYGFHVALPNNKYIYLSNNGVERGQASMLLQLDGDGANTVDNGRKFAELSSGGLSTGVDGLKVVEDSIRNGLVRIAEAIDKAYSSRPAPEAPKR
jgi:hypothetical protein